VSLFHRKQPPKKRPAPVKPIKRKSLIKNEVYWFGRIQALIKKHSTPARKSGKYKGHGMTNAQAWVRDLVAEVHASRPRTGMYDGNMWLAGQTALILAHWYFRLHRAKCYDPRRPVAMRKEALKQRTTYAVRMFLAICDESQDAALLPGQHWDDPGSPHAVDGVFL